MWKPLFVLLLQVPKRLASGLPRLPQIWDMANKQELKYFSWCLLRETNIKIKDPLLCLHYKPLSKLSERIYHLSTPYFNKLVLFKQRMIAHSKSFCLSRNFRLKIETFKLCIWWHSPTVNILDWDFSEKETWNSKYISSQIMIIYQINRERHNFPL